MFNSGNRSVCCMVSVQGMLQIYSMLELFFGHISINMQNIKIDKLNLYPAIIFNPENGVCFLRLLHIFKCTSDQILSWKQTI